MKQQQLLLVIFSLSAKFYTTELNNCILVQWTQESKDTSRVPSALPAHGSKKQWRKKEGRHLWQRCVFKSPCHPSPLQCGPLGSESSSLDITTEWHWANYGDGDPAREPAWWLLPNKLSRVPPVRTDWLTVRGSRSGQGRTPGQSGWHTLSCFWQQLKLLGLQEGNWHLETARTKDFPLQLLACGTEFWRIIKKEPLFILSLVLASISSLSFF